MTPSKEPGEKGDDVLVSDAFLPPEQLGMLVHLEAKDPRPDALDFGSRLGSQPSRAQPSLSS